MRQRLNFKNLIHYVLIIAMYYLTGGAFSYTNYQTKTIAFFVLTLAICVCVGGIKKIMKPKVLIVCILQFALLLLVPLLNLDRVSSYVAIVLILWSGMFAILRKPK